MPFTMKAARVNAGLTQEEAAKKLEVSKATLLGYENGKTVPRIDFAQKMAKLYQLSVDEIIFLKNNCT